MVSKPQPCEQKWLDMTPACGGRICGKCHKLITDFTKMDWYEIEQRQQVHHNNLCGIYTDKQLRHWGRRVTPNKLIQIATSSTLITSIALSSVVGQSVDSVPGTIIRGTITGITNDGRIDTLIGSSVYIENTQHGTVTDERGAYELDITKYLHSMQQPMVRFSYTGFTTLALSLNSTDTGIIEYNPQLEEEIIIGPVIFYARRPTFGERMNLKLKEFFSRKKK